MMFGSKCKARDQLIAKMERQLDLIHTALVVRDPGTSVAAEAYEGLRKQVIAGATARQAHTAQLAEFDVALRRGASTDDLLALSAQWLDQAGIACIEDPTVRDAFDSSVPPGVVAEVQIPAYVNKVTGQLVRQGRLRAREAAADEAPTTEEAPVVEASIPAISEEIIDDVPGGEDAVQIKSETESN
jgi:hypothetical protein